MNFFKLTKRNNEDLDRINIIFYGNETKVFPLVPSDYVCRQKSEGGLGIKTNSDVNKASITKLDWRILIEIERDSKVIIDCFNKTSSLPSSIIQLMEDI